MNQKVSRRHQRHKVSPSSWWATAAYSGKDTEGAKAALVSSGFLAELQDDWRRIFSSMARGEALIRGANDFRPSRDDETKKNAAYYRVLQWRLVMSYAGLEIFVDPLIRMNAKKERGGFGKDDFLRVLERVSLLEHPPLESPRVSQGLFRKSPTQDHGSHLERLVSFLNFRGYDKTLVLRWLGGSPITEYADACCLAKAFRNSIAHGSLSPQKTRDLGLHPTIQRLSKTCDEVRRAVLARLYDEHHGQR